MIIILLYLAPVILTIYFILKKPSSSDEIGAYGENEIVNILRRLNNDSLNGIVLENVYIPKDNDETSEIDVLFITTKGIFVIESKNYSGYIFGNEKNLKWTCTLPSGRGNIDKYSFYNPIKQNESHIYWLKKLLNVDCKYYSIVCFSNRCEFKDINVDTSKTYVCHREDLVHLARKIILEEDDSLTKDEVVSIRLRLMNYLQTEEKKTKHISSINNKLRSTDTCPICGGSLVTRTAKKGPYAGNTFLGCSNYPKCKYIKND